jgi:AraC family transcriptional regulator of adaptative response / DNA-3-methyladenine glycosylase II
MVRSDSRQRTVGGVALNHTMTLDFDTCYRAVVARDARFDGRFFTAVTSTGIYCRPICPARTPARANMRFFAHAGAAEAAGFRACRRCRPEASPGSPDWNTRADLAARAVRLISSGYVDAHGVRGLAARLAVTERHLHRLLVAELGTGPLALATTARVQTARRLLAETDMPITDIAFASGFASVRQFNATVRQTAGATPSQLRARARLAGVLPDAAARPAPGEPAPSGSAPGEATLNGPGTGEAGTGQPTTGHGTWLCLRLACREPFDSADLLGFLCTRAIPGVEQVTAGRYARTVRTAAGTGIIELLPCPGQGHVLLRVQLGALSGVGQVVYAARRLLDADADPAAIDTALAADRALTPLVRARPGLRVPGTCDGFELAVRAVLGQQVSVAAARTFAGRLAARHGTVLARGDDPPEPPAISPRGNNPPEPPAISPHGNNPPVAGLARAEPTELSVVFPTAADLADADLSGLGLTTGRQRTLRALAQAAATGRLNLDPGADPAETAARLAELPGVGPWTISYILLRSGDPDAFPGTDLGVRRAMERLGCPPAQPARWRPWRGYAVMHLWIWYADGAGQAAGPASARVGGAVASSDRSGRRAATGRR